MHDGKPKVMMIIWPVDRAFDSNSSNEPWNMDTGPTGLEKEKSKGMANSNEIECHFLIDSRFVWWLEQVGVARDKGFVVLLPLEVEVRLSLGLKPSLTIVTDSVLIVKKGGGLKRIKLDLLSVLVLGYTFKMFT
jgi:hypothetical protein